MTETILVEDGQVTLTGLQRTGGRSDLPLIIAIHGGGCHAGYFDIPGYSLLDRAHTQGHDVIALNRPGYGGSTPLPEDAETLQNNADRLNRGLAALWQVRAGGYPGIVLIGHSIGAAITMIIAAEPREWPLLGIAISGAMATLSSPAAQAWAHLPRTGWVERPAESRDPLSFGDPGSYAPEAVVLSHAANARSACLEGYDIAFEWPRHYRDITGAVDVPVHMRQAECDALWVVTPVELDAYAASFSRAPSIDAAIIPQVGHCIDHHLVGPQFHDEQLAFARATVRR